MRVEEVTAQELMRFEEVTAQESIQTANWASLGRRGFMGTKPVVNRNNAPYFK